MMRSRWQIYLSIALAVLAVGLVVFGGVLTALEPRDMPSPIPRGILFLIGLFFGAIALAGAAWIAFFHIKAIKWLGFAILGCTAAYFGYVFVAQQLDVQKQRRAEARVEAQIDAVAARYLSRLEQEAPNAYASREMFNEYLNDLHSAGRSGIGRSDGDRVFRARWFIYYWTFYDPDFAGFTTFYPTHSDCGYFLEQWGERYAQIAPVAVFDELCTERWNPDGTERD